MQVPRSILPAFPIVKIRQSLGLNRDPWDQIPDDYLKIVFLPRSRNLQVEEVPPAQMLEYLGDRITDLVISRMLIDRKVDRIRNFLWVKDELISNRALKCMMDTKDLCKHVVPTVIYSDKPNKPCADSFETLVGLLYWYLNVSNYTNSLSLVESWLVNTWGLDLIVGHYLETEDLECNPNKIILKSGEAEKAYVSRKLADIQKEYLEATQNPLPELRQKYKTLLKDTNSESYREYAENPEYWDLALLLAHRFRGLPITNVPELIINQRILGSLWSSQNILLAASKNKAAQGAARNVLKILYPEYESDTRGLEEIIQGELISLTDSLDAASSQDLRAVDVSSFLRTAQVYNMYPQLKGLNLDNPANLIRSLVL